VMLKIVMALKVAIQLLLLLLILSLVASENTPNIVFIFADDLGWNHVSWNNPAVLSPRMQELAETGVILDQSYVQPLCTPSRSALMTGMYPFHLGRQHGVLWAVPTGLSRNYTLVPEKLSTLGYNTHMIGKWHYANYPLRGNKGEVWEGGTRGAGFIHSPLLQGIPRVYNGLMHVTDWYNTLLDIAGEKNLPNNDGFSQWEALRTGQSPSPRNTLIYNIDETDPANKVIGAIRVGNYKYVMGERDDINNEEGPWLFDLSDDPNETSNLISEKPLLASELEELLLGELNTLVPADLPEHDPAGDPSNWGGVVSPGWCPTNY
ncbi:unnamed protein product, partial [Meganyctiphanes norvegica]